MDVVLVLFSIHMKYQREPNQLLYKICYIITDMFSDLN